MSIAFKSVSQVCFVYKDRVLFATAIHCNSFWTWYIKISRCQHLALVKLYGHARRYLEMSWTKPMSGGKGKREK